MSCTFAILEKYSKIVISSSEKELFLKDFNSLLDTIKKLDSFKM